MVQHSPEVMQVLPDDLADQLASLDEMTSLAARSKPPQLEEDEDKASEGEIMYDMR